jgi:hypothetical protein
MKTGTNKGLVAIFALATMVMPGCQDFRTVNHVSYSANDSATKRTQPDGTVYAGISPENQKPVFTTPADARGLYSWAEAMAFCEAFNAYGHKDWQVPNQIELNVLFSNRAGIGGFNQSGERPSGWYWSSSRDWYGIAWGQRFGDGDQRQYETRIASSLRCVR